VSAVPLTRCAWVLRRVIRAASQCTILLQITLQSPSHVVRVKTVAAAQSCYCPTEGITGAQKTSNFPAEIPPEWGIFLAPL